MDSKQIILKENETIDNFKHLSINVKINSPYVFVKNIKINTPKLSKYLEKHNIVVLSDGGVDAHRGKSEQVYIYLNDVDKKSLMSIIKDFGYVSLLRDYLYIK